MAQYDPLKSANNVGDTEYAGGPGFIQPKSRGHDLGADTHGTREKAYIMRYEGIRAAHVMPDLQPNDLHYDAIPRLEAERRERLGEWSLDDALG